MQPNDSVVITCKKTKREEDEDPQAAPKKKKRAISEEYRAKLLQSLATANERKQSLNAVRRSIKVTHTHANVTVQFD